MPAAGVLASARRNWEDESAHGQYVSALNLQARELNRFPAGNTQSRRGSKPTMAKVVWHGAVPAAKSGFKRLYAELAQRNSQASVPFLLSNRG